MRPPKRLRWKMFRSRNRDPEKFWSRLLTAWKDIIERFAGQPYPTVYRAFGRLRHRLGRIADERPWYPYTFADSEFVYTRAKTRD